MIPLLTEEYTEKLATAIARDNKGMRFFRCFHCGQPVNPLHMEDMLHHHEWPHKYYEKKNGPSEYFWINFHELRNLPQDKRRRCALCCDLMDADRFSLIGMPQTLQNNYRSWTYRVQTCGNCCMDNGAVVYPKHPDADRNSDNWVRRNRK